MIQILRDMAVRYYNSLTIGLGFLLLVVSISAIREFVHYSIIQDNIQYQKEQQTYRSEKIAFEKNFLIPYLKSSVALPFYKHENSILSKNEYVIHRKIHPKTIKQTTTKEETKAREDARKTFLQNKRNYIIEH